jgi:hypothetical protein
MMPFNRGIMMRFLTVAALLLVAIGANAALFMRGETRAPTISGETRAIIGGTSILVPRAYVRDASHWAGGRLQRLDLQMRADDLKALPERDVYSILQPDPPKITVTLQAATSKSGAAERFQLLYSRFVSGETRARPDGLVTRGFRPGTPYDDREIHIGAGIGRHFYALCPKSDPEGIEPCSAVLLASGLELEIRFPAARLGDWRRIGTVVVRMVEDWRAAAAPKVAAKQDPS